jgi:hypothetical protein
MNWPLVIILIVAGAAVLLLWNLWDRFRIRRDMQRRQHRFQAGELDNVSIEDPKQGTIRITDTTIDVEDPRLGCSKVAWSDLDEIRAFKRDLFAIDLICLVLYCGDEDEPVEVHERMQGYKELIEALESRLGIDVETWWRDVAFPPFDMNLRTVWQAGSIPH